ncbi:MAG: hypothetical protein V3V67_18460 [Myxococcota bacterium]
MQARVNALELTLGAAVEAVKAELEDARSERRSAASLKASVARWKKEAESAESQVEGSGDNGADANVASLESLPDAEQVELLEGYAARER